MQKCLTPACIVAAPGKVALTSDMNAHNGEATRDRSPSPWLDTWHHVGILSGLTQSPGTSPCLLTPPVNTGGTSGASRPDRLRLSPIFASCAHSPSSASPGIEHGGFHLCGLDLRQRIASHLSMPKSDDSFMSASRRTTRRHFSLSLRKSPSSFGCGYVMSLNYKGRHSPRLLLRPMSSLDHRGCWGPSGARIGTRGLTA